MVYSARLMVAELAPPIFRAHETILFQGDSITDGNRGRTADPNHILGHGYVFIIAAKYGAQFADRDLTFVNKGISGNRVADLADRWDADTFAVKPDVLSILIGINDIYQALTHNQPFSAPEVEAQYDQLIARSLAKNPSIRLILGEPFVLNVGMIAKDSDHWNKSVKAMDKAVGRLAAKYHVPVVRYQRVFTEAAKSAPADHWIWDGIHPTYSGHQLMADEWIRVYNNFYVSPLDDPERNSAIKPVVNFERDSYNWLHRHADILDLQAKRNPDVVMIGDSITHFWAGEPKSDRASGPKAWADTFGKRKVINMGYGWDRTQNVLWRLQNGEFDGLKPKTIILNIGTNNLVGDNTARTNTPEEVAVGIKQIVDTLRAKSPDSNIIVMAVFPRGFERGNELDTRIQSLNKMLSMNLKGQPQVTMLDIRDKLREQDGSISPRIMSDGTHPTEEGYAIWGKAIRDSSLLP